MAKTRPTKKKPQAKKKSGKWIQKIKMKKGALSKQLGIPEKEDIPVRKLKAAAKKKGNSKLAKRARLALTLKKLSKKRKRKSDGSRKSK